MKGKNEEMKKKLFGTAMLSLVVGIGVATTPVLAAENLQNIAPQTVEYDQENIGVKSFTVDNFRLGDEFITGQVPEGTIKVALITSDGRVIEGTIDENGRFSIPAKDILTEVGQWFQVAAWLPDGDVGSYPMMVLPALN